MGLNRLRIVPHIAAMQPTKTPHQRRPAAPSGIGSAVRPLLKSLFTPMLLIGSYANAQSSFAYRYDETVERVAELPSDAEIGSLSAYDLTATAYHEPERAAVAVGYDAARGLFRERVIAEPLAGMPEWKHNVPARYETDRDGRRVYNETGALVSEEAVEDGDDRRRSEAMAARGEARPYRTSVYPDAEMLASLERAGFREVGRLSARSGVGDPAADKLGVDYLIEPSLTLSDGEWTIVYDTVNQLEMHSFSDESGALAYQYALRYAPRELATGEIGYFEVGRIEMRPDSLGTGERISRTTLRRRTPQSYTINGVEQLLPAAPSKSDLSVYPNPFLDGRITVLLPEETAGVAGLQLHDATGRLWFEGDYGSTVGGVLVAELPTDLPPGSYALTVTAGFDSWTRLLIVR